MCSCRRLAGHGPRPGRADRAARAGARRALQPRRHPDRLIHRTPRRRRAELSGGRRVRSGAGGRSDRWRGAGRRHRPSLHRDLRGDRPCLRRPVHRGTTAGRRLWVGRRGSRVRTSCSHRWAPPSSPTSPVTGSRSARLVPLPPTRSTRPWSRPCRRWGPASPSRREDPHRRGRTVLGRRDRRVRSAGRVRDSGGISLSRVFRAAAVGHRPNGALRHWPQPWSSPGRQEVPVSRSKTGRTFTVS